MKYRDARDLKTCPFCGKSDRLQMYTELNVEWMEYWKVRCSRCEVVMTGEGFNGYASGGEKEAEETEAKWCNRKG